MDFNFVLKRILRWKYLLILEVFTINLSFAQTLSPQLRLKTLLCDETGESSGLIMGQNSIWTFNDSGGWPDLYEIDTVNGELIRTVRIINASNHDWEAITSDEKFVYIGDIGNNRGSRKSLSIYRISKEELFRKEVNIIKADTIIFNYAAQKAPRTVAKKSYYDSEAMFCLNDTLYLINKNWTNQAQAMVYRIPAQPGSYSVESIGRIASSGLICDAALSHDKRFVITIGYVDFMPFAALYKIKSLAPFQLIKVSDMEYPKYQGLQTEGCAFGSNNEILVTCEKNSFFANALYLINLK